MARSVTASLQFIPNHCALHHITLTIHGDDVPIRRVLHQSKNLVKTTVFRTTLHGGVDNERTGGKECSPKDSGGGLISLTSNKEGFRDLFENATTLGVELPFLVQRLPIPDPCEDKYCRAPDSFISNCHDGRVWRSLPSH